MNQCFSAFIKFTPLKFALLGLLLALYGGAATAQSTQAQPVSPVQPKPTSLSHLYWHFLIHQSNLDAAAAQLDAQGKNGNALRNDLQTQLGFSEADYAPIRTSSQRLASELRPLQEQFKGLKPSQENSSQLHALSAQCEAYVSNEIYSLSLELTPQNRIALEKFGLPGILYQRDC